MKSAVSPPHFKSGAHFGPDRKIGAFATQSFETKSGTEGRIHETVFSQQVQHHQLMHWESDSTANDCSIQVSTCTAAHRSKMSSFFSTIKSVFRAYVLPANPSPVELEAAQKRAEVSSLIFFRQVRDTDAIDWAEFYSFE